MILIIGIFAKRDIAASEELCFDYGNNETTCSTENDKKIIERKLCHCKSDNCREYLPNIKIIS